MEKKDKELKKSSKAKAEKKSSPAAGEDKKTSKVKSDKPIAKKKTSVLKNSSTDTPSNKNLPKKITGTDIPAEEKKAVQKKSSETKLEKSKNKFFNLLTGDDSDNSEPEEIDPEALARGDNPMTVVGHLDELRSRVLLILASFIILTCIAFYYSDILVYYINKPFLDSGNKLNIFTLVGGFMLKFKVSAATALFILVPIIIFQIWRFIAPAIDKPNRTFSRMTIISAILLFYTGAAFVFFILLPAAIKVMLSFVGKDMISTIGADDYLNFILFSSLIMGVLFEVPVIILVLTRMGLISPQLLIRKRKYAVVIIWVIAAIVTPQPDPLSQSLVGVPLMFLYEISILISKIVARRERKKLNKKI